MKIKNIRTSNVMESIEDFAQECSSDEFCFNLDFFMAKANVLSGLLDGKS